MTARDLRVVGVPHPFVGHLRRCRALLARLDAFVSVVVSVRPEGPLSMVLSSSDIPSATISLERALMMRVVVQSPVVDLGAVLGLPLLPGLWPRFWRFSFRPSFFAFDSVAYSLPV